MTDKTYNGWANYETWATALWLANDPGTYENARRIVLTANDAWHAQLDLRYYVEDLPDIAAAIESASLASDLLGAALSEINWKEIAEHYRDEARDE